jgi:hypothetical protein
MRFNNVFKSFAKNKFKNLYTSKQVSVLKGNNYFNVFLLNKVHKMNFLMIQNSAFIMNAINFLKNNNSGICEEASPEGGALVLQLNGKVVDFNL